MNKNGNRRGWARALGLWLAAALLGLAAPLLAPTAASADGPPTGNEKPVLLLHGYELFSGPDCGAQDMWGPAIDLFHQWGWKGQIHTMAYYTSDTNCTDRFASGDGTQSINDLGRQLAWYIYNHDAAWGGGQVAVVAHSMGGLIIRDAIGGTRTHRSGYPPSIPVDNVVTLGTPHQGTLWATSQECRVSHAASWSNECFQMIPGSDFLNGLPVDSGEDTKWAAIGAVEDGVVGGDSAVGLSVASPQIRFDDKQNLGHSELHDGGNSRTSGWTAQFSYDGGRTWNDQYTGSPLLEAFLMAQRDPGKFTPPPPPPPNDCSAHGTPTSAAAGAAIAAACSQEKAGTWYTWGGGHGSAPGPTYGMVDATDPVRSKNDPYRIGFDCSGLVRWAWSQAVGYDVMGDSTAAGIFSMPGQRLGTDTSALQPGDLVFWGVSNVHHVAVYLGAGKIVEARESDTHVMVSDLTSHDMSDYAGGLRFAAGGTGGGNHMTWGSNVNVRSTPSVGGSVVVSFPGPTPITVDCQKHAESVTAEGVTNDVWAHLSDYNGWVSNIYIKGGYWLDGVPDCGGSGGSGEHSTWGTSVNVRSQPSASASVLTSFAGPTAIHIDCQKHAESVTAAGVTNDAWAHLPDVNGWVSNIFVKGAAWLDGVPDCGGGTSAGSYSSWGTFVNLHAHPSAGSDVKATLAGPTTVKIGCQKHAESVTAEGITNDAWSYLPDYKAWVSNIYIKGAAWLDGIMDCTKPPALDPDTGGGTSTGTDGQWSTWGTNVNLHSHPRTDSSTVTTLAGPTTVQIGCQKHAGAVTAEGVSNDAWSYLPAYKAWVSNIYVKGGAWLDGVIDCTVPPALDPETQT
ncbi:cell wall-associated NlpC family hydrolase [Catenulispora sp. EB89]|uniref:NlpC/P60 family protein n=1 Tax=Catenulispora sp. EB89 TaxID=3156257 RepID=UPI0035149ED4